MSDISGAGNNNIHIQQQVQPQNIQPQPQIQPQENIQQQQSVQQQVFEEKSMMTFATRPSYMNKGIFKKDSVPGINPNFGFGDILYTMAQAGKASGACGGNFMCIA